MIYRKWSLLTGPPAILAGVVGTVLVAHLLFVDDPYLKRTTEKPKQLPPSK